MAISNAVQRGVFVYVFNESGQQTATILAGNGEDDGLMGYTQNRVNVRRGGIIYSYDENGSQKGTKLGR